MVIATRADVNTRSIVRLPDADTSKKGYKFTDPDGEFPRVVPLPVQGDRIASHNFLSRKTRSSSTLFVFPKIHAILCMALGISRLFYSSPLFSDSSPGSSNGYYMKPS